MSESLPGKRTVTLPTDEYLQLQRIAESEGVSLAAWVLDATRTKRARQAADAFTAAMADPDLQQEMAERRKATAHWRADRHVTFAAMNADPA